MAAREQDREILLFFNNILFPGYDLKNMFLVNS